jgi:hypothetical protein
MIKPVALDFRLGVHGLLWVVNDEDVATAIIAALFIIYNSCT